MPIRSLAGYGFKKRSERAPDSPRSRLRPSRPMRFQSDGKLAHQVDQVVGFVRAFLHFVEDVGTHILPGPESCLIREIPSRPL